MRNPFRVTWLIMVLLAALAFPGAAAAQDVVYPDVIQLPNAWLPEGIAIGTGHTFYSGSRANGAVYRGDLRTGEGEIFVQGTVGRVAVGLKYDQRCDILLVAGGGTGQGYIYDGSTGEPIADFQFSTQTSFINDVVVTNDAAYFTNSRQSELYRVDLKDCRNLSEGFETIPLSGDWQLTAGNNANGIVADPSGKNLIVVHSALGALFHVDPETGVATRIDLGGEAVPSGDGLLLHGQTLYVVQNRLNLIAEIELNQDWSAGTVVRRLSNPNFDVPTTVGLFGNALYAVNARFGTTNTPDTTYTVVRVELN